jgi:uncharacterized protein YdaU (DUF1376 family)
MAMMPWFHRDFLAATQGWTAAECGAYFLLLGAEWEMGQLPKDTTQLAAIARATPKEFKAIWRRVGRKFSPSGNDGLINARLEQHRANALELREQHRKGAKETNEKRWGNRPPAADLVAERSHSDQSAISQRSQCVSPPSPSPSLQMLTKGGSDYLRSTEGVFLKDGAQVKT